MHQPADGPEQRPTLHRQITPRSLRVRHNNRPLFTELNLTRLGDATTVAAAATDFGELADYYAPEVRRAGLAIADTRSDTFGLCTSLRVTLDGDDPLSQAADAVLEAGCEEVPETRASLQDISARLAEIGDGATADGTAESPLPGAEFWDEDTIVPFQQSRYKVISRLGGGGVGQTFKVVELDTDSDERFGTYVAKLVRDEAVGKTAIRAYKLARAYTTHPNLSAIHEIAAEWEPDRFAALLRWVEGMPLDDLNGVLTLYAEEIGETSDETLVRRWLRELCDGLSQLHRVGLVHGDVSPRNIIVQGGSVVLTDYDTVLRAGETPDRSTLPYASPAVQDRTGIEPGDDIYALAASLFEALADREPFLHGAERRKDLGLCWDGVDDLKGLRAFLDRATAPEPAQRFRDALEAGEFLRDLEPNQDPPIPSLHEPPVPLTESEVPWLKQLPSTYPGSRYGNVETRGLDSPFALETYVETRLDEILLDDIRNKRVNLVILFGNAGDGKTAFLQHLVRRLGVEDIQSSRRVWQTQLADGRRLMVNLDGAAAWQGRDANDLLDELFAPFQQPDFPQDRVHLVAVNNGKLLEWIETRNETTWLTSALRGLLLFDQQPAQTQLRLIDLNRRSLVGGIVPGQERPSADFINALIDRLLGGDTDHWQPCATCTAQARCTAWQSVQRLRDPEAGPRLRAQLTNLLQACHQRGEIHITARELRAALSYGLFGIDACADLHANPDERPVSLGRRIFDATSPRRQGELAAEMARFDPALESDPLIDRKLLRAAPQDRRPGAARQCQTRGLAARGRRRRLDARASSVPVPGRTDHAR